eukprot:14561058-Alexandrium_andersonii.AAC.1
MATSSGPVSMMSPAQTRSQITTVTLKERQASVLQRAKPCLVWKSDRCCPHDAGADRSPRMASMRCHAILPATTPIFLKYSGGGRAKTGRQRGRPR